MERIKLLVVAPIIGPTAIQVVRHLQEEAFKRGEGKVNIPTFNYRPNDFNHDHMEHVTLAPPFWASYRDASRLSLGLSLFDLKHQMFEEPTLNCRLQVKKLGWFRNEHEDILKLDVGSSLLLRATKGLRQTVQQEEGYEWCYPLPEKEPHLHLTICSGRGIHPLLAEWVNGLNLGFSQFRVRIPCLLPLARYRRGWRLLSYNLALDA